MSVITEIQTISETIANIIDFVKENEKVKEDFSEYLQTINAVNVSNPQLQVLSIPYITERTVFKENKTIPELYISEKTDLSDMEKEIAIGLNDSISSIFEIKKRLNNGFVMYNMVNEKTYTVIPLVKMGKLKEVCPTQFTLARIFKFRENYFLLEISNLIPSYEKDSVMNFAIAKIIEKPEDLYLDNEEKFEEVKNYVEQSIKDFIDFFETDEIITTNNHIDNLVEIFDKYQKTKNNDLKSEIPACIETIENLKFIDIKDFSNSYDTFLQKSMGGFSSHEDKYDIGYLADSKLGIYIIPFWATLCKIFTDEKYKEIENYKDCVTQFIKNDRIPPSFIEKLIDKSGNKEIFEKRLQEITQEALTIEDFIKKYKGEFLKKTIFSSANALYCSKVFTSVVEKN